MNEESFVMSEHKRTFLLAMRFLWIIFEEKEDFDETKKFIEKYKWRSSQERNRYEKILKWVSSDGKLFYSDIIVRLENLIFSYEEFFFKDISVLESEFHCPFAYIQFERRDKIMNAPPQCLEMECSLLGFLKNRRENLIM